MSAAVVVTSYRRYIILKAYAARARGDEGIALAWFGKLAAVSGTALAVTYPHLAALTAAFYTTVDDLTGATVAELVANVPLTTRQATTALAAL